MELLIPASGYATRMNGIPKFLLPIGRSGETLLERHVKSAEPFYEKICIAIRPELEILLDPVKLSSKVNIYPLRTNNMSETVSRLIESSTSNTFGLVMPDTYFYESAPYEALSKLEADVNVAVWKIRQNQKGKLGQTNIENEKIQNVVDKDPTCSYPWFWGALSFNRKFAGMIDPETPHIGYALNPAIQLGFNLKAILQSGEYYDCGTPSEYFDLIDRLK